MKHFLEYLIDKSQRISLLVTILCTYLFTFADSLYVGEPAYIDGPYYQGIMDAVAWYSDKPNNINLSGNANGCSITITSYFSGTATVECQYAYHYFVGTTKYNKTGHTKYNISCRKSTTVIVPSEVTIGIGEKVKLSYKTSSGYDLPYTYWKTDNKKIASFQGAESDVDNPAILVGESSGECVVTLYANTGDENPTCKVIVKDIPATGITLSPDILYLKKGSRGSFKCTLTPSNASPKLNWTSSDEGVATVNGNGQISGVGEGRATITVTTDNGYSAHGEVIVQPAPESVYLDKDIEIWIGYAKKIEPHLVPDTAIATYKWKSDSPKIATVDAIGRVKGVLPGTAIITVTTDNGKTASTTVHVIDAPQNLDPRILINRIGITKQLIDETLQVIK